MKNVIALLFICLLLISSSPVKVTSSETRVFHKSCVRNAQDESNLCILREDAYGKVKMFKEKVASLICKDKLFSTYNDDILLIMSDFSENSVVNTEFYTGYYKDKVFNFIYNITSDKIEEFEEWKPNFCYSSDFVDNLLKREYSEIERKIEAASCNGRSTSGAYYYQAFVIDYFDEDSIKYDALIVDLSKTVTNIYHYQVDN